MDAFRANEEKKKWQDDMDDMLKVFLQDDISEFHYVVEDGEWRHELKIKIT